jgi:murein DD-endopeptidase MepM/ murein hydrolase activator NlpD
MRNVILLFLILTIYISILFMGCGKTKKTVESFKVNPKGVLLWPMELKPNNPELVFGFPDINGDGKAFNCKEPGYRGHEGTDISITFEMMDMGVDVYAAADGIVKWAFDGKFDRCPNPNEPDCMPPSIKTSPGTNDGYTVCTENGNYCKTGNCCCYWCFNGGNVLVIEHRDTPGVFATRYDHLKKYSLTVFEGDTIKQGQVIGQIGSSGKSSGPHLHFEVWGKGYYDPIDPWGGSCGTNYNEFSMWTEVFEL